MYCFRINSTCHILNAEDQWWRKVSNQQVVTLLGELDDYRVFVQILFFIYKLWLLWPSSNQNPNLGQISSTVFIIYRSWQLVFSLPNSELAASSLRKTSQITACGKPFGLEISFIPERFLKYKVGGITYWKATEFWT